MQVDAKYYILWRLTWNKAKVVNKLSRVRSKDWKSALKHCFLSNSSFLTSIGTGLNVAVMSLYKVQRAVNIARKWELYVLSFSICAKLSYLCEQTIPSNLHCLHGLKHCLRATQVNTNTFFAKSDNWEPLALEPPLYTWQVRLKQ